MMIKKNLLPAVNGWRDLIGNALLRLVALCLLPFLLVACGGGGAGSSGGNASVSNSGSAGNESVRAASSVPPTAPTGVAITSGNGEVAISWDPVSGATSYNVYYLTYPGVTTVNSRQLTQASSAEPITGLTNTVAYYFIVTAVNDAGESAASSEVSATPMPALPGIPGNVRLTGGFAEATLHWQAVPYATSYNVYYGTSPGLPNASSKSFKDNHLTSQKITGLNVAPGRYYFRVTAVDASGEGSPSVELAAVAKSTFKSLAAGFGHSAVLRIMDPAVNLGTEVLAGTVWAVGDNSSGQLGDGTLTPKLTAVKVPAISYASDIAAGYHHTVSLMTDKAVMDWGLNNKGQLGANSQILTTMNSSAPLRVSLAPAAMTKIAAGYQHTLALKDDGTVWSWGWNLLGALGYSSLDCANPVNGQFFWTCSDIPTQVTGITGSVTAIAGGFDHTLAVTQDGQVWSWGRNDTGQLGTLNVSCNKSITQILTIYDPSLGDLVFSPPDAACNTTPVPVNAIPGSITAVSAGTRHSVALMSDGTVWAWGGNHYGQLGYTPGVNFLTGNDSCTITSAFTMKCSYDPKQVPGLDHIVAVSAGSDHTLALKGDGTVWALGYNNNGQLGTGSFSGETPVQTPVQVTGLTGITAIAAGAYHSLALKDDGTVWAWGDNSQGQLGDNTKTDRASPVQVQGLLWPVVIIPGR
jgi:alpha-tubulin suppressor-like RCC1 family protein